MPLPARVAPMMATLADALPADDERWAYEMKWDGVRAVVHVEGGRPTAWSRNDIDITDTYPELRAMAEEARETLTRVGARVWLSQLEHALATAPDPAAAEAPSIAAAARTASE